MSSSDIRQIGDPLLHKPAKRLEITNPYAKDIIIQHLAIMRANLYATGGVGIASLQCANLNPCFCIIIVGTDDEAARAKALARYPEVELPSEIVMINPHLTPLADSAYPESGEGCLSVKGCLRGRVARYTRVKVDFFDEHLQPQSLELSGLAAHIACHECDHLKGITFIERLLEDCTLEQRQRILHWVTHVINKKSYALVDDISVKPQLVFQRDEENKIIFSEDNLQKSLTECGLETLSGLRLMLKKSLSN